MKFRDNVRILGLALVLAYADWVPSAPANTKPDAKQSSKKPVKNFLNPSENEKKAVVGMIHVVTALDIHQATNNYFNDKKNYVVGLYDSRLRQSVLSVQRQLRDDCCVFATQHACFGSICD